MHAGGKDFFQGRCGRQRRKTENHSSLKQRGACNIICKHHSQDKDHYWEYGIWHTYGIKNKVLLYSTGNYTQYSVIYHIRKYEKDM